MVYRIASSLVCVPHRLAAMRCLTLGAVLALTWSPAPLATADPLPTESLISLPYAAYIPDLSPQPQALEPQQAATESSIPLRPAALLPSAQPPQPEARKHPKKASKPRVILPDPRVLASYPAQHPESAPALATASLAGLPESESVLTLLHTADSVPKHTKAPAIPSNPAPQPRHSLTPEPSTDAHSSPGPRIASMSRAIAGPVIAGFPVHNQPGSAPAGEIPVTSAPGASVQPAEVLPAPDPSYQVLYSLPRYQGGAPPIQAITLDPQGHPIRVIPKNSITPAASAAPFTPEPYNTLFQAESSPHRPGVWPEEAPSIAQQVAQHMAQSLQAYRENEWEQAAQHVQQALQISPKQAELHAALGEIRAQQGQTQQAIKAYRDAVRLDGRPYQLRLAQLLALAGQRQDAIAQLEALEQHEPGQAAVAFMLGTLYEEQGQTEKALTYLRAAASLQPASADIHYNLALALELAGRPDEARQHYRTALRLNPDMNDAAQGLARVQS